MRYLSVQHATKAYGQQTVFTDIQLDIEEGSLVTLLGPSGCGKSTLLRAIAGLTPLDEGEIWLDGRNVTQVSPQHRQIAMVFQSYALFPNMTVFDNIAFGLKMQKLSKQVIVNKVARVLELVELTDFASRYPHQLSGGQSQRVALARSLVVEPKLLLLDEPLSALDARIRKHLREQIRAIQQELKLTTVFVTHDQEESFTISDRVILMHQGKMVQDNVPEQVYLSPVNQFAAGFIGNYNILNKTQVVQISGHTPQGETVAIRPEAVEFDVTSPYKAVIQQRILLGNVVRYQVMTDQQVVLNVDKLNVGEDVMLTPGDKVGLLIKEKHLQILH